jgi:tellurite resistance protein TerC
MNVAVWGGFIAIILLLLAVDLFVLNRKAHIIEVREALLTTLMWVAISLLFNVAVYFLYENHVFGLGLHAAEATKGGSVALLPSTGREAAIVFFTGYLVELMLSLDNMLVIAMILAYFRVPAVLQHRVLFWGIIGAVVLRGAMIVIGAQLVQRYGHWVLPAFGVILLLSAFKMLVTREDEADIERNLIVRASRKVFNLSPHFDGERFFTRIEGKLFLTPLMVALLVVDVADLIFAVDSIPAIFGITTDPFIVFSSNCFAILGLRSIYFALAALIRRFRYLKVSMVFILGYIGVKMIADQWFHITPQASLITIACILAVGVVASLISSKRDRLPEERPIDDLTVAAEETWKRSRKIVILILGFTIVFIIAPLVGFLPGPGGIFVAIGGVALLATEFVWARKLLTKMKEKAMRVTGGGPSAKPPKLWKIPVVIGAFGLFVAGLIWIEHRWQHHLPDWANKNVYFLAIGPGIAVAYWSIMTLRRWTHSRKASSGSINALPDAAPANPEATPPTSTLPSPEGSGGQRQRAGST